MKREHTPISDMFGSILSPAARWLRRHSAEWITERVRKSPSNSRQDPRPVFEWSLNHSPGQAEHLIDWETIPGSEWYRLGEVARALAGIRTGSPAAPDILYVISNNHAGELYPASVAATTILLNIALAPESLGAAKRALDVIDQLVWFYSVPSFDSVIVGGSKLKLENAIRMQVEMARPQMTALAEREPALREVVLELLESIDQRLDE